MAGRKTIAITDRQFAVLRALWAAGPLTVRELLDRLPEADRPPYTTMLGLLQSMEKGGLVVPDRDGPAHRYRPTLSERAAGVSLGIYQMFFFLGAGTGTAILGAILAARRAAGTAALNPFYSGTPSAVPFSSTFLVAALAVVLALVAAFSISTKTAKESAQPESG